MKSFLFFVQSISVLAEYHDTFGTVTLRSGVGRDQQHDDNGITLNDADKLSVSANRGVSLSGADDVSLSDINGVSSSDADNIASSDAGEDLSTGADKESSSDAENVFSSDAGEGSSSDANKISPSDADRVASSDASWVSSSVGGRISLNAKDEHFGSKGGSSAPNVVPAWTGVAPDGYVILIGKQPAKTGIATLAARDNGILKTSGSACSKLCTNDPRCNFFQYSESSRRCFLYDRSVRVLAGSNTDYAFFIKSAVPDIGINVGSGRCLNSDKAYSSELRTSNCRLDDRSGDKLENCRNCCRSKEQCRGFSVSVAKEGGGCLLYGESPLMAEIPRDNTRSVHCFVRTEIDAIRWPLTRAAHFRGCFTFTSKGRSFEAKGWVASTAQCASACVRYDAFSVGLGGYCVCELSDEKSHESSRVDDTQCAGQCRRETALPDERRYCSTSDSKASALFRMSSVEDGSPCPEAVYSGKRRYIVLLGNVDAQYAFLANETVASCGICAGMCDSSSGDNKCHGYTCTRRQSQVEPLARVHFLSIRAHNRGGHHAKYTMNEDDNHAYSFDCSLYRYPIPTNVNFPRSYMCTHQHNFDTSCAANYLHFAGFKYIGQGDTLALITYKRNNACNELCAKACDERENCNSYQCAASSDFCHLYKSRRVDISLTVADVSVCVKIPSIKCASMNGFVSAKEACHCTLSGSSQRSGGKTSGGGMVCDAAQFCSVDENGDAECLVRAKVLGAVVN
eukprot:GEMP01016717.1.p1 GENE.GEMP01016717.1~~GEMP01016717.1.p1  ORF type:complete len:775 (+),score=125.48 GEMP01016717.1:113-2326(+)